jgi:hypothetical protein
VTKTHFGAVAGDEPATNAVNAYDRKQPGTHYATRTDADIDPTGRGRDSRRHATRLKAYGTHSMQHRRPRLAGK